ncbi:MAG: AAA family ATPase [Clostridia bacterium]|nr:AAA family ATPase [Clostridia bacterium]
MKKRNNGNNGNLKLLILIILIIGLFALLCGAAYMYFVANNGTVPIMSSNLKYLFLALIVLLPMLLLFLILATVGGGKLIINPDYFGVDFKKMDKERPKLENLDNYNPGEAKSFPAPVRAQAAAAAVGTGAGGAQKGGKDEDINTDGSRFYMLTEIDKEYESYERPDYDDKINLKELCEDFRNFSAGTLKLYYDIEDIRRFIGGLAVTKLIILQGMSGTGKTSLAYAFGEYLGNKTVVVPIQPMWKERTDLLGYYNEFTRRFNETTLLYKMYEANNNEEIYITVLDEMNIARVEYYFAEFLSLLEIPNPDGRNLDVVADRWDDDPKLLQSNGKMKLPTNMWFIGTANNDDSTFSISDKVYDRAMVINLDKKATPFEAVGQPRKVSATHLQSLMDKAQREYALSDRNYRRLKQLDEYMIKTFHITFGNRIMKQIKCYVPVLVACGGTEVEALDDILARKIFRKLESKNPVYVKQMADGVCDYLDELFGENALALCKETIRLIEQNV